MATVKEIASAAATEATITGVKHTRQFHITGLVGADQSAKMVAARTDAGIPAIGAAHPSEAAAVVVKVAAKPLEAADAAHVTVEYEEPEGEKDNPKLDTTGVLSMASTTTSETVTEDKDGNFMSVVWTGTLADIFPDAIGASSLTYAERVEAQVFRPAFTFTLTRRETSISTVAGYQRDFTGKVNDASYTVAAFAARTVLFRGAELEETTPSELRVRYNFEYNPNTWDLKHWVRLYGRIPTNADDSVVPPGPGGLGVFQVYPTANFALLPVTF